MAAAASREGVTVLAGTDAGMGPHGMVSHEVARLLDAGLPPEAALGAASWVAREYLGLPGIVEGAAADLILFDDDPRKNLRRFEPPRIVLLEGRLIRPS
jgi:imidazolonepropionase-like amidohydrolase